MKSETDGRELFRDNIINTLKTGDLVVMKSDTIYGIFARALDEKSVAKLHEIRERDLKQGFIILADSAATVAKIVDLKPAVFARLQNIWRAPHATSVILSAENIREKWLPDMRPDFANTICFRVPHDEILLKILRATGPLCAPSANLPNQPPAKNIAEAQNYFGENVPLYVDNGEIRENSPSRIIKFRANGTVETIRPDNFAHPEDFVISRKRKLYKFAKFLDDARCFDLEKWTQNRAQIFADFVNCHPELVSESSSNFAKSFRENPKNSDDDFMKNQTCVTPSRTKQSTKISRKNSQNIFTNDENPSSRNVEIIAEIGAGSATFLTKLAAQNPAKIFVAMDRKSDRLWQGAKLAHELNLANIFYVWSEAAKLNQVFAKNSVSEIWLTFPDPFAKENYQTFRAEMTKFYHQNLRFRDDKNYQKNLAKYQKKLREFSEKSRKNFREFLRANDKARLTSAKFLAAFAKILRTNGRLNFKTDNAPLFEWSLENFAKNGWRAEFISRNLHNENIDDFAKNFKNILLESPTKSADDRLKNSRKTAENLRENSTKNFLREAQIMTTYEQKFTSENWPICFARFAKN